MAADDAWSAEIKRLPFTPDPDPLAVDDDLAERLLDGDLPPDQTPPGYAEVAARRPAGRGRHIWPVDHGHRRCGHRDASGSHP